MNKHGFWSIDQNDLSVRQERTGILHTLPSGLGRGESHFMTLDEGLTLVETVFQPHRDLVISTRVENESPQLVLTFGLHGKSAYIAAEQAGPVTFSQGIAVTTGFRSCRGERCYRGGELCHQLRLIVRKSWLSGSLGDEAAEAILGNDRLQLLRSQPLEPDYLKSLRLMKGYRHHPDPCKKMKLQGHALLLLSEHLSGLIHDGLPGRDRAAGRDVILLEKACSILEAEFRSPPTVDELAGRIGTSASKLKRLFQTTKENTPYSFVLNRRMDYAMALLSTGRYPIKQVAERVGYQHVSNFTTAFRKHYGYPPGEVCRPR